MHFYGRSEAGRRDPHHPLGGGRRGHQAEEEVKESEHRLGIITLSWGISKKKGLRLCGGV